MSGRSRRLDPLAFVPSSGDDAPMPGSVRVVRALLAASLAAAALGQGDGRGGGAEGANKLAGSSSPYLLAHSAQPVHWLPWGEEALALARKLDKPIFLSIGYSACHWCHVMAKESFVDPEVARVGLTEREAAAQGIPVEVTRYELARLDRAITDSCTTGFVKVLTRPGKDTILGVAIVGAHAGECLAEYVLAMTHGIGLNAILRTVHAYPTMAEASRFVAGRWRANHLPAGWLRLAERYHAWRRG